MAQSRRKFLAGSAAVAAIGATSVGRAASPSDSSGSSYSKLAAEIVGLFEPLPGTKSIKIWSPATHNRREFAAELDPGLPLFCGSSFKAFVLGEALRQNEASNGNLTVTQLKLDESIWSLDSAVFNPPYLSGLVSERTALEAMVSHSDNTGADMNLPDAPIANEGFFATHFFTVRDQEKSKDFYVRILGGKVIRPENPCYIKLANT